MTIKPSKKNKQLWVYIGCLLWEQQSSAGVINHIFNNFEHQNCSSFQKCAKITKFASIVFVYIVAGNLLDRRKIL